MSRKRVCVFASSSNFLAEIYYEKVHALGTILAENDYDVVYGGSNLGLMCACVESAKAAGAKIIGVMPEKLHNILGADSSNLCDELHVTETMRTRKAKLDELSDAVITVPGGFGTLEELSEMIVQKQLGYNSKPIVIFNVNGFYDKMLEFFEVIISERFANQSTRELYYVTDDVQEVVFYLKNYTPVERVIDKGAIYNR